MEDTSRPYEPSRVTNIEGNPVPRSATPPMDAGEPLLPVTPLRQKASTTSETSPTSTKISEVLALLLDHPGYQQKFSNQISALPTTAPANRPEPGAVSCNVQEELASVAVSGDTEDGAVGEVDGQDVAESEDDAESEDEQDIDNNSSDSEFLPDGIKTTSRYAKVTPSSQRPIKGEDQSRWKIHRYAHLGVHADECRLKGVSSPRCVLQNSHGFSRGEAADEMGHEPYIDVGCHVSHVWAITPDPLMKDFEAELDSELNVQIFSVDAHKMYDSKPTATGFCILPKREVLRGILTDYTPKRDTGGPFENYKTYFGEQMVYDYRYVPLNARAGDAPILQRDPITGNFTTYYSPLYSGLVFVSTLHPFWAILNAWYQTRARDDDSAGPVYGRFPDEFTEDILLVHKIVNVWMTTSVPMWETAATVGASSSSSSNKQTSSELEVDQDGNPFRRVTRSQNLKRKSIELEDDEDENPPCPVPRSQKKKRLT